MAGSAGEEREAANPQAEVELPGLFLQHFSFPCKVVKQDASAGSGNATHCGQDAEVSACNMAFCYIITCQGTSDEIRNVCVDR